MRHWCLLKIGHPSTSTRRQGGSHARVQSTPMDKDPNKTIYMRTLACSKQGELLSQSRQAKRRAMHD